MPLNFIVDEMLPQHLTYWLREQGFEATHVDFENLESGPDPQIWKWASMNDAVIISKDHYFPSRIEFGKPPRVLWVRWGNTRKQRLIQLMRLQFQAVVEALNNGEWLLELTDLKT
jgi:predicted nuclease of predicted toxin-antitoxin system